MSRIPLIWTITSRDRIDYMGVNCRNIKAITAVPLELDKPIFLLS